jgi:anti-anti-sigma factor
LPGLREAHSLDAKPRTAVTWPRPNVAHVVLEGEHDMASASDLERALGETLHTCSQLLVDLSSVQFIDSSTIKVLIKMKREADDERCNFRLVLNGEAPNIEHTLEICGVLGPLNRVATVDAALMSGGTSANP